MSLKIYTAEEAKQNATNAITVINNFSALNNPSEKTSGLKIKTFFTQLLMRITFMYEFKRSPYNLPLLSKFETDICSPKIDCCYMTKPFKLKPPEFAAK